MIPLVSLLTFSGLTSCSSFFNTEDTGLVIKSINTVKDGNSNTIVTITYENEDQSPLSFTIPAGMAGKDGVSVSDIQAETNEDRSTTLTIKYSDSTVEDTVLTIPPANDGVSVTGVDITVDEETKDTTLVFKYSNDTTSDPIVIPAGKDGKDAAYISGFSSDIVKNSDTGENYTLVTVSMSDESQFQFTVDNGLGIDSMYYDSEASDDNYYVISGVYTDGSMFSFQFPKPQSTTWRYGSGSPASTLGKTGDFYLDVVSGEVYTNEDGTWKAIFSIKGTGSTSDVKRYYVYFFKGDADSLSTSAGTLSSDTTSLVFSVDEGSYLSLDSIPSATREGYIFDGWYTDPDNVNSGQFTDLTVVTRETHLYPKWIQLL